MISKSNPPYAPNLIESMRSIGYSFETALADIIDNSISAKATKVEIRSFIYEEQSFLSIIDDGFGMSKNELFKAMKYGSYNPNDKRGSLDMGRFGLGLKSASLSQCRKLTVLSKKENQISGYIWDIDFVIEKGDWCLQELDCDEIRNIKTFERLDKHKSGTLVMWERFDRIKNSSININEYLKELLVDSIEHFSLVYHRLLSKKFKIIVNGMEVTPRDPFLENHKSTQLKREQKIKIDGSTITVKPYILPHINKLSNEDIKKIGGKESLRTEQGFYIYRNRRLIIWGTWFRLGNKNELFKLARVKVDIPNDIDYLWDIDIKKSRATLPDKIKVNLYNAVLESCGLSEKVHIYKGRKALDDSVIRTWNIIKKRKGEGLDLQINLSNPLIEKFFDSLDSNQQRLFMSIIEDIEQTIPFDYIYSQVAKGKNVKEEISIEEKDETLKKLKKNIDDFVELGNDKNILINIFINHEKYANDEYIVKKLEELRGD